MADFDPDIDDDDEWDEDDHWDDDDDDEEYEEGDEDAEALDSESIYEEEQGEADGNGDEELEPAIQEPTDEEQFAAKLKSQLDPLDPMRRVEAVLFLAKEPLHSRKLSQLAFLQDGTQARSLVKQLNKHYDEVGRAFNVKQVAGGFQMRTRPMFSPWLKKIKSKPTNQSSRLSGPAMETLSVVAYRQPVLKADVEAIRGVSCGELLRQLLDRGLVRITGRSPELGNPFQYGTTRRFLELFGLSSIDALPRGGHLRGKGLPDWHVTVETAETSEEAEDLTGKTTNQSSMDAAGTLADASADSDDLGESENLTETTQNPLDEP